MGDEEEQLVSYIKTVTRMHYVLTKKGIRELACRYAKRNKKKDPKTWDSNKMAGEKWIRHFMKRHYQRLCIRISEATNLARATGFNKTNFDKFMTNLDDVHHRFGSNPPERIWNLDETGCITVQAPPKMIAPKG